MCDQTEGCAGRNRYFVAPAEVDLGPPCSGDCVLDIRTGALVADESCARHGNLPPR